MVGKASIRETLDGDIYCPVGREPRIEATAMGGAGAAAGVGAEGLALTPGVLRKLEAKGELSAGMQS